MQGLAWGAAARAFTRDEMHGGRRTGHRRGSRSVLPCHVTALLPANVQKRFFTVIRDVATTGNSGSGVFDAGQKCVLDIMSRKITVRPNTLNGKAEEKDIAKYFVPASTIRAFTAEYRF